MTPQPNLEWVDPQALAVTVAERVSGGDRFAGLFASAQADGSTVIRALLAGRGLLDIVQAQLPPGADRYPALTPLVPPASWYEREIHDLFGIEADGHPRLDPLLLPVGPDEQWRPRPGASRMDPKTSLELDNSALSSRVAGQGLFTIAFGPVRSGVFESVEYLVETFGEDIPYVQSRVHYKHRGIESRFGDLGPDDGVLLAERVEGTASVAHALAYCQALETLGGVEVPPRAGSRPGSARRARASGKPPRLCRTERRRRRSVGRLCPHDTPQRTRAAAPGAAVRPPVRTRSRRSGRRRRSVAGLPRRGAPGARGSRARHSGRRPIAHGHAFFPRPSTSHGRDHAGGRRLPWRPWPGRQRFRSRGRTCGQSAPTAPT